MWNYEVVESGSTVHRLGLGGRAEHVWAEVVARHGAAGGCLNSHATLNGDPSAELPVPNHIRGGADE